jgi:hypothetical protein
VLQEGVEVGEDFEVLQLLPVAGTFFHHMAVMAGRSLESYCKKR